ncbi:hypothetical protein AtubIFM56815_004725 [Aspergillus tubingensis]|uniref:SnoaL-like domain-containing protein n=1 Tax=Aspergillus tubingensis TaxID=5068 RepID=A0A9W6AGJ9_ASPTU|nr:hypothetical protein AtubIFM54640_005797 [Aspergillus tubingensis]GLA81092.1 hypothetical protein AtubIFM56815_004725 [Aspergillus tubingensis]GLA91618.1 hypothetical protein AtubIFM57143_005121 [Aspergillus tubingensis]GLB17800.1 hypothetical protein AtubIFM61612_007689 [Aspergillus tubingensis]
MLFPIPKAPATSTEGEVKIPLLFFVQRIQRHVSRLIYEVPSDEEAMTLVDDNYSSDALFEWNSERLDLDGFKKFVQEWRTRYTFLDFEFHEAVATPDVKDEEGRGGTIGFALKGRVVSKDDGKMYGGKVQ